MAIEKENPPVACVQLGQSFGAAQRLLNRAPAAGKSLQTLLAQRCRGSQSARRPR